MSRRWSKGGESSRATQRLLPFADVDIDNDPAQSADHGFSSSNAAQSRPIENRNPLSGGNYSTSYSGRTPARSFLHHASHSTLETPQYSSQGVRDKSQALASYALNSSDDYSTSISEHRRRRNTTTSNWLNDTDFFEPRASTDRTDDDERSEPETPDTVVKIGRSSSFDPSPQTHKTSVGSFGQSARSRLEEGAYASSDVPSVVVEDTDMGYEEQRLLPKARLSRHDSRPQYGSIPSRPMVESKGQRRSLLSGVKAVTRSIGSRTKATTRTLQDPETWSSRAMMNYGTSSAQVLSGVFLGTLLNILDGLSYGLILFPLGHPIFANTGPDGISIYYVSCIVSQLVFSCGASIFKGGVGSEMIEVVPFFHKMAYAIMAHMGEDDPAAVLATVITAMALSSVLTGLIFLALGLFKLGNLVSFFPRSILTGCIGGVGFFLFLTGIEVSARIDGSVEFTLATVEKLFASDTVLLWTTPLLLSIVILTIRHFFKNALILPGFYAGLTIIFYIIVKGIVRLDLEPVREVGWIFPKPEAGVPFWRFYTYFRFDLVNWGAIGQTIPTMFALSFFGIIHVPINVPALGLAMREDNVNINRELIAHGISNSLSGCVGSIQNYLVYANSYLLYQNSGSSRATGIGLAIATAGVWMAGPAMVGFIPVLVVGTLIYMLGIELLKEAVWDTWGKLHKLEYLTIIAIVLIMGLHDFVVGIVAGIVLACLNYVVQTSRTPAIRAKYSGQIAESTVRRPPLDKKYLDQVGSQIMVEKLSGYLFFGTIVAVEQEIRALIEGQFFMQQPIRYVILDMAHVTGIDFSAAEAFERMNRILCSRNVKMVLSNVSFSNEVGQSLSMVGLLDEEKSDPEFPVPQVFEDLNNALEACENELIEVFHKHRLGLATPSPSPPVASSPPIAFSPLKSISPSTSYNPSNVLEPAFSSPRNKLLIRAATNTMQEHGGDADLQPHNHTLLRSKWAHFAQPVRIMLQTFEDVSSQTEDFWHRAAPFFQRRAYPAGTVLYSRGDEPDGFFILESGRFRADYDLEQGTYYEVILPGTTCGELPFFSETDRTGTVAAEEDCVAWLLTREKWGEMEAREPEIARELLKIGLKFTSERMGAITSYVLVTAS